MFAFIISMLAGHIKLKSWMKIYSLTVNVGQLKGFWRDGSSEVGAQVHHSSLPDFSLLRLHTAEFWLIFVFIKCINIYF